MSDFEVEFAPIGPDQAQLDDLAKRVVASRVLRQHLGDARHELIAVRLVTPPDKTDLPLQPSNYRATVYDYTKQRTLIVQGPLADPESAEVRESEEQPLPSQDEFDQAVAVLARDPDLGPLLDRQQVHAYPPMPPLGPIPLPDGRLDRTVAVGILPVSGEGRHEIVAVNLRDQSVIHFENGAPPAARAHASTCGVPNAHQATTKYAAGQLQVTMKQGATIVWDLLVVRPAASSGTNGSGVELRQVKYRGNLVLARAHVPILNVRYDGNACGPFRDWQHEEGKFNATGSDVRPGFRQCTSPPQTILDSGNDHGNFGGVAIYQDADALLLVSEMEAGWYRYISEWRLHVDGTISPRFGFASVDSSCVCARHHHHVYWRFDFDITETAHNFVQEYNNPPITPGANWETLQKEVQRYRDPAHQRYWRVGHVGGAAYDVIPGPNDGTALADSWAAGDVWVLRFDQIEFDDGVHAPGAGSQNDQAHIDKWVDGESVYDEDVVLWYGAHFTHDPLHEGPGLSHLVGPDLKPINWP